MTTQTSAFLVTLRAALLTRTNLALENAALRQQLTIYQKSQKRTRLRIGDRTFGFVPRRLRSGWERALIVVRPETANAWHRLGLKLFWRRRSLRGKVGRLRSPREHDPTLHGAVTASSDSSARR
jgi:hypothetical protein